MLMVGGVVGFFLMILMWGVCCGLFSNEVGQGLVLIVYVVVCIDEFVCEGFVVLFELFIDMLVICMMIGLVIVIIGVWKEKMEQMLNFGDVEVVVGQISEDSQFQVFWDECVEWSVLQFFEVCEGVVMGGVFVVFNVLVEDVKIEFDGLFWNGMLMVVFSGVVLVDDVGFSIMGKVLFIGVLFIVSVFCVGLLGECGDFIVIFLVLFFVILMVILWFYYGD